MLIISFTQIRSRHKQILTDGIYARWCIAPEFGRDRRYFDKFPSMRYMGHAFALPKSVKWEKYWGGIRRSVDIMRTRARTVRPPRRDAEMRQKNSIDNGSQGGRWHVRTYGWKLMNRKIVYLTWRPVIQKGRRGLEYPDLVSLNEVERISFSNSELHDHWLNWNPVNFRLLIAVMSTPTFQRSSFNNHNVPLSLIPPTSTFDLQTLFLTCRYWPCC